MHEGHLQQRAQESSQRAECVDHGEHEVSGSGPRPGPEALLSMSRVKWKWGLHESAGVTDLDALPRVTIANGTWSRWVQQKKRIVAHIRPRTLAHTRDARADEGSDTNGNCGHDDRAGLLAARESHDEDGVVREDAKHARLVQEEAVRRFASLCAADEKDDAEDETSRTLRACFHTFPRPVIMRYTHANAVTDLCLMVLRDMFSVDASWPSAGKADARLVHEATALEDRAAQFIAERDATHASIWRVHLPAREELTFAAQDALACACRTSSMRRSKFDAARCKGIAAVLCRVVHARHVHVLGDKSAAGCRALRQIVYTLPPPCDVPSDADVLVALRNNAMSIYFDKQDASCATTAIQNFITCTARAGVSAQRCDVQQQYDQWQDLLCQRRFALDTACVACRREIVVENGRRPLWRRLRRAMFSRCVPAVHSALRRARDCWRINPLARVGA